VTKAMVTLGFIKCGEHVDHLIERWLLNSALPCGQSAIALLWVLLAQCQLKPVYHAVLASALSTLIQCPFYHVDVRFSQR